MRSYLRFEVPIPDGAKSVERWETQPIGPVWNSFTIRSDGRLVEPRVSDRTVNFTGGLDAEGYTADGWYWHLCALLKRGQLIEVVEIRRHKIGKGPW